jgi:hypothetical protein
VGASHGNLPHDENFGDQVTLTQISDLKLSFFGVSQPKRTAAESAVASLATVDLHLQFLAPSMTAITPDEYQTSSF